MIDDEQLLVGKSAFGRLTLLSGPFLISLFSQLVAMPSVALARQAAALAGPFSAFFIAEYGAYTRVEMEVTHFDQSPNTSL
jgi:hypothetical protein